MLGARLLGPVAHSGGLSQALHSVALPRRLVHIQVHLRKSLRSET